MLPGFSANEFVVYPAHGVGQVIAIEVQTVAGASLELFVLYFAKSKMTLRVPTQKAESVGMRKLSSPPLSSTFDRPCCRRLLEFGPAGFDWKKNMKPRSNPATSSR